MTVENSNELLQFTEVTGFARRRFLLILIGFTLGAVLGFTGSTCIPKKYRSKALLTIQSGYFHHPLISDTVAGIQDTAEMNSQRSALLRLALDDEFLESFGRKFFSKGTDSSALAKPQDYESILKHIEYFPTNPTSFQISVTTNSPTTALRATDEILTQIITTLERQRYQRLAKAHRSLVQQATLLQHSLSQSYSAPERDTLQSRMRALRARLAALEEHLSENHPDVIALKRQLHSLSSREQETAPSKEANEINVDGIFLHPQARSTTQEIIDDLLKKISFLAVVLHMRPGPGRCSFVDIIERPRLPTSPFSPNRVQVTLIGAAAGLFIALSIAIRGELHRRSTIQPTEAETFLDIKLLGELPLLAPSSNSVAPTTKSTP